MCRRVHLLIFSLGTNWRKAAQSTCGHCVLRSGLRAMTTGILFLAFNRFQTRKTRVPGWAPPVQRMGRSTRPVSSGKSNWASALSRKDQPRAISWHCFAFMHAPRPESWRCWAGDIEKQPLCNGRIHSSTLRKLPILWLLNASQMNCWYSHVRSSKLDSVAATFARLASVTQVTILVYRRK